MVVGVIGIHTTPHHPYTDYRMGPPLTLNTLLARRWRLRCRGCSGTTVRFRIPIYLEAFPLSPLRLVALLWRIARSALAYCSVLPSSHMFKVHRGVLPTNGSVDRKKRVSSGSHGNCGRYLCSTAVGINHRVARWHCRPQQRR